MKAEEFGLYIRKLRKEKKLTIRQLELYSGVSNSYLSQIENGKRGIPAPPIIKKLHEPLGVSYEELMQKAGYIENNKDPDESIEDISENRRKAIEELKNMSDDDIEFLASIIDKLKKR